MNKFNKKEYDKQYSTEHYEYIGLKIKKELKKDIQVDAALHGMTISAYIWHCIQFTRENENPPGNGND